MENMNNQELSKAQEIAGIGTHTPSYAEEQLAHAEKMASANVTTVQAVNVVPVAVSEEIEKPYTLRKLCARDIFPFSRILAKVGIKQFQDCFTLDDEENLTLSMSGLGVALNAIDILLNNLDKCENEIYSFLAGVSGMSIEEIMNLDMDVFAEMIIDVFKKKEFSDFFKAVSRLLGLEY